MSEEEREELCESGENELLKELGELIELANDYGVMEGLEEVFGLLGYA